MWLTFGVQTYLECRLTCTVLGGCAGWMSWCNIVTPPRYLHAVFHMTTSNTQTEFTSTFSPSEFERGMPIKFTVSAPFRISCMNCLLTFLILWTSYGEHSRNFEVCKTLCAGCWFCLVLLLQFSFVYVCRIFAVILHVCAVPVCWLLSQLSSSWLQTKPHGCSSVVCACSDRSPCCPMESVT